MENFLQSVIKGRDRIVYIPDITTNFNMYKHCGLHFFFILTGMQVPALTAKVSRLQNLFESVSHLWTCVDKKFPIFRLVCKYNVSNVLDLMFLSQTCWNNAPNVSHLEKLVFTNIECAGWLNKMAKMHEIYSDFKPNESTFYRTQVPIETIGIHGVWMT